MNSNGVAMASWEQELPLDSHRSIWHTVNDAVLAYGSALIEHPERFGTVTALGLDETGFVRLAPYYRTSFITSIVDVGIGQLLDIVEGRGGQGSKEWLKNRDPGWKASITHGTLDLSSAYKAVFTTELPDATLVADPFHVVKVATEKLDETRRRVQNETLGHRGRKDDPLFRCRRLLTKAEERLSADGKTKLKSLLEAGDPKGDVATAWATPRKPFASSTAIRTRSSRSSGSMSSPPISATTCVHPRFDPSVGPSRAGSWTSRPGVPVTSRTDRPTDRPKPWTT